MKQNKLNIHILSLLLAASGLIAQNYDGPDFNGDGQSDLAQVWGDEKTVSLAVLSSGKDGVAEKVQTGSSIYDQAQRWFYGDFNGDLLADIACLRNDDGKMSCEVYLSTDTNADFMNDSFKKTVCAKQSGEFSYSDKWFSGDFDGDSKTDLARVCQENGSRSVTVYRSTASGFSAPEKWADQQGKFNANDLWLTGSFDVNPGTDFAVVEAGNSVNITLLASTGSAFNSTNLVSGDIPRLTAMKWVAEDFNGDGSTDLAALRNRDGSVHIDLYFVGADGVTNQFWTAEHSAFEREHKWLIGDFNGDARADIARLWNDAGFLSIETFEHDGSTFTPRMILKRGRPFREQDVYMPGDFNGDGLTDIAIFWADAKNRTTEVVFSTRALSTVKTVFVQPLENHFNRQNLVHAVGSDTFINYAKLDGATPPEADLQAVLDSGNDLLLKKKTLYQVSQPLRYKAAYQRIQTKDALFISDFAIIRQQIDQGDYDSLIVGSGQDFIHLENVRVDGNKYQLGQKGKLQNQAQGAMVFFSAADGVWIRRCLMYNARTWSTCHLVESGDARNHIAEYNYVLGAGDDPRGCGKYVDPSGRGVSSEVSIGWCDGFSISAVNVTARYNFIMDCTDVGLVLFGAPGSHVHDNLILNYSRDNHGGINMVDDSAHRFMGMDSTFGKEYKCYDYRNLVVENNRIVASGCRIQIGMPLGNRIWKRVGPAVFDFDGGVIRNNLLEGDAMGYGYVLDYVKNVNFYGNKSIATHSGKGRGTSDNGNDPDAATTFLFDPDHVRVASGGTLQEGFTCNTKPIEHLLFHNGTPLTADRYHYYEYTEIEAEAMVKAAYLEMLGRDPTGQELSAGKNFFLIDPKPETLINEAHKQYGDAFRRELMKRPEFIQKFGAVPVQNLQLFRVARWRDRIQAMDKQSILQRGVFENPGAVYNAVLTALRQTPDGLDAEIVNVEPPVPAKMTQGGRAQIAVTVKNTGKTAWKNSPGNPAPFALASVGDDTTFGITRARLPDGVTVQPGQNYTFVLDLSAPPVAWAGRENPAATRFPYDLKMIQESVGYFGKTLSDRLGSVHQIEVAHVAEPPPAPRYHASFISQTLQGDPQINGIRPGAKFAVQLTFKNSGNFTSQPWTKAGGFSIGSESPKDNRNWGTNRLPLDEADKVSYGKTVTFTGVVTAPKEEGNYAFQWQLLGAGWFGDKSPGLTIKVSKSAPEVKLTNPGFTAKHPLLALRDRTDEHNAKITAQHSDSIPEQRAEKLFDNDSATKFFTANPSTWIQHQFADGARYKVVQYAITSAPDAGPGPEMMTNGSFESDQGWKLNGATAVSTDDRVSGKSCLKIASQAGKNIGNSTFTIPGLKPDTEYALSFWMRQEPDTQGAFVLDTDDMFDRTCQWVKNGGQPTVWTRYRAVFNTANVDAGKTPNPASLTLRLRADALIGTVYVDDISLVETSGGGALGDPSGWTLAGSNDGNTWTKLDSRTNEQFSERNQRRTFEISQPDAYEYYRLTVRNKGGETLQFGELEYFTGPDN